MEKKLEELKNLLDSGAITESEYQELKKKLLDENVEVEKQNESSVTESIEEDLFEDLIAKYNPNEKDLFLISFMQDKIKTSSSIFMSSNFFKKQELKAKVLKLLKPYKVKFMDLGDLIPQIAEKKYHLNKELQEKYDTNEIESITISPLSKALNNAYSIIILSVLAGLFGWFVLGPIIIGEDFFWENKDPNASHIISDEEIEDDEVYEDMYSEEDYEDHPEEENTDLLYPQTSDEDHDGDIYTDPDAGGYAYSLVDKLNFRDTPYIKDDNIIRRLRKGERLTYGPNFLWEIELINDKGLLNSEVDIFYKEKAFSLPSGKSVQILEQFRRDDGYEFTEMVKCSANLGSGDVTFSTEKTNVDFISVERWVRLTDSYGNSGYVYERFVELDMYDYYEVYNTYMDQEPYLNLRSEPTSKSINITRMSDGTKLILLSEGNGSNGKWMKVRVLESGKVGYAHTKWIRKINEE